MTFIVRMAVRETRASWRRLLFFFLCIAVGVGAIAALRSIIQNVRSVLASQARALIAADVLVSSATPLPPSVRSALDARAAAARATARTESIETATMVRPADEGKAVARVVELRGVQDGFPLYGTLELRSGLPYRHALLRDRGALVRPELLTQLGLRAGDRILIGTLPFTIRGIIEHEPGRRVGGFSLGPRVIVDYGALQDAGLLSFGSRARYQVMLRVDERRVDALLEGLRADLKNTFVTARSFRSTEDEIGQDLQRAENYLSLVGLVVVVLGGIGVSSVTRVFIDQKLKAIAVLKCVGAGTWQVVSVYLVQVMTLGLGGSLMGLALGRVALAAAPQELGSGTAALPLSHALTPAAMAQAVGIGLMVSLLFSLVPLLRVRHIRPSLLLRRQDAAAVRRDWLRVGVALAVGAALMGVAGWQAGSWKVGAAVCGGFAVLALVLNSAGWALVRATAPLARARAFAVRHAVLHLNRPGNQTRVVLMAVGLGAFFMIGIRGVQSNLLREFALEAGPNTPDLFLIDIQADQVAGIQRFLTERTGHQPRVLPVLRARITQVRGKAVTLDTVEDVRGRGSLAREYTVTYRPRLEGNERVVAGRFWDPSPADRPEISIEESIRERFGIGVGDEVRFDILGQPIVARVTSVREVNWRDSRAGGFMFVFRPGVLEAAPHGFIAPARGPSDVEARARLQRDLVAQFSNVSVIDIREVLDTVRGVIANVTLGIAVVGGLVLFTGVLILVGAVAMTKYRRVYEAAILKTLGASSRVVGSVLLVEYGLLGLLAGTIGAVGGGVLSWAVSRYVIETAWHPPIAETGIGVVLTTALVAIVGLVSNLDVLRRKPLTTLRAE
jgi:putative ABC transport system permease protein